MLKTLWQYFVKYYLQLGLFFYYRRLDILNRDHIPKDKPVLILGNHQSALMDALFIVSYIDRFVFFLTRASVFKKSFVDKLLRSLNMLPVYRIRDGWNTISNNNQVFEFIADKLGEGRTVAVFPEGSHSLVRRVRPLSKGFTRIIHATLEKYPDADLQLMPVGVNYQKPTEFADSASLIYGQPIPAQKYMALGKGESVVALKKDVHEALSKLTTSIPVDDYDETLRKLDNLNVNYVNPDDVNACIANSLTNCKTRKDDGLNPLRKLFKLLLIINVLPPYLLWKLYVTPKIKEPEFMGTFRFAVALLGVPIYLVLVTIVLGLLVSFKIALLYLLAVLILALLAVKL